MVKVKPWDCRRIIASRRDRVLIKRVGNAVVLLPEQDTGNTLFDSLKQFDSDLMDERSHPATQVRADIFE